MPTAVRKPANYADLEAVPPHLVAEFLFGEFVTHPRPAPRHGIATSAFSAVYGGPLQFGFNGPGGWMFADEPELRLGPHVVVPDLMAWRRERLPPETVDKEYIEVPPDRVLEVLSPSTEKDDRGRKRRIYAEFGIAHLWYLDPRMHAVETFKLGSRGWTLTGTYFDTDEVRSEPFNAIAFSLGLLWPFDVPPATPS